MTDRDLTTLLERGSEHLAEVDFVEAAWAAALAERSRRRRRWVSGAGAVAAAAVAVGAVQLGGSGEDPTPTPTYTTSTPATTGTLGDGTAYALMPLEGKEGRLRQYAVGLPSVVDPTRAARPLSSAGQVPSVVAVYLRRDGNGYAPVLLTEDGTQYVADLLLRPVRDEGGNERVPLGPRAMAGGEAVYFPQPGEVVRLDVRTGRVDRYAVPSPYVEDVAWSPALGRVVVRADQQAWTLDPWAEDAEVVAAGRAAYGGLFRLSARSAQAGGLTLTRQGTDALPEAADDVRAPVSETWGETLGSLTRAASGAFFDQDLTNPLIRLGNGPIYQGLVAVDTDERTARVLLAPENPDGQTGRFTGCCRVLGWANGVTVLFQSVGSHGSWVLAWDVSSGEVYRVTRIEVDPSKREVPQLALNVGWRY
jgi:hypothetical protein